MTFFNEANEDARTIDPSMATTGRKLGFLDSFDQSVETQMRTASLYGVEYFMHELDWQQTRNLRDAGVEDAPQLILDVEGSERAGWNTSWRQWFSGENDYVEYFIPERSQAYSKTAAFYADGEGSPELQSRLKAYDDRILELRKSNPDVTLMTSREMFDRVRTDAQAAERAEGSGRRSGFGKVGGFLGGMAAGMHPGTDPLNFYSAPVGGLGRNAVQRIGAQAAIQGGMEAGNQLLGVQESRERLGLSHGLSDAAMRIGMAAAGGAVLQGAGEGIAAAGRRWFRSAAHDPAPLPADMIEAAPSRRVTVSADALAAGHSRTARVLTLDEMREMPRESPFDLAIRQAIGDAPLSGVRPMQKRYRVDLAATSAKLDDWGDATFPAFIRPDTAPTVPAATSARANFGQGAVREANVHIAARSLDPVTMKKFDTLADERAAIVERLERVRTRDNVEPAVRERAERAIEAEIAAVDAKAQRMAPAVAWAYTRARREYDLHDADARAIVSEFRNGNSRPELEPRTEVTVPVAPEDRMPAVARAAPEERGGDAVETTQNVVRREGEEFAKAYDRLRADVARVLGDESGEGFTLAGGEHTFNLNDKVFVPHESGNGGREITVRELLDENRQSADEIEAVSTCSLRSTS